MEGHWDKKRDEVTRLLTNALHAGAFPVLSKGPMFYTKDAAVHAVEDFLDGEYPMFVVHVEDILDDTLGFSRRWQRWINLRKRKHWRRYARRHNLNPKTGARRG